MVAWVRLFNPRSDNMKQNGLLVLAIFGFQILVGCATQPVVYNSEKDQGQWEAKAQIKDLIQSKTNNLSLQIMAQNNRFLRMEITGLMGVNVASLLLKGDEVSYAIHNQKRFISGLSSEKALVPLLNVNIDPRWLYNVFFDVPFLEKNWSCQKGLDLKIEKCERLQDKFKIQWSERQGENKRVTLSNDKFEIQVLVKDFKTKVQSPEKAFTLSPPEGYKRYKLQ